MALPPQHGAFIANCRAHCQTGTDTAWHNTTVNGTSMGAAFRTWYQHAIGHNDGEHRRTSRQLELASFRWVESAPACDGNDGSCHEKGNNSCG
jgi:hypothetical protein